MDGVGVWDSYAAGCVGEEIFYFGVGAEIEDQVGFFLDDASDGVVGGENPDFGQLEEIGHRAGWFTEHVVEVLFELVEVFGGSTGDHAAVDIHALAG